MSWQSPPVLVLPSRYLDRGVLGQGSMGEVRRVRDSVLDCDVAMKLLASDLVTRDASLLRFRTEAEVTAKLQHPAIIAIHDYGRTDDGRPWFTMPMVEGRTLHELIGDVHRVSVGSWRASKSGWTLRRLVEVLAQVAQAVGFAHEHDVLHRDIKPANVMVGRHGEVLLMDWGIARGRGPDPLASGDVVDAPGRLHRTLDGLAIGTPPYMPPEQAMGRRDLCGPQSDVYGLGAVLYRILAGRAPYRSGELPIVEQVRRGPPPSVRDRVDLPLPDVLVEICERAMQRSAQARYNNGAAVASALESWLEAQKSRDKALAKIEEAHGLRVAVNEQRAQLERSRVLRMRLEEAAEQWHTVEEKRELWRAQDVESRLERGVAATSAQYVAALRTARVEAPDLEETTQPLVDWYRTLAVEAEEAGDRRQRDLREQQVARLDRARLQGWLEAWGSVSLTTDPPGARVEAFRYERSGLRLVPVHAADLGTTPVHRARLQRGSYVLRITAPGCVPVSYPVVVQRGRESVAIRPGADAHFTCQLPRRGELADDDCYVPAGWFAYGGHGGGDAFSPGTIWVDAFVVKRFMVTVREYLDYLLDSRDAELPDGEPYEGSPLRICASVHPDRPIDGLSQSARSAYAAWRAAREGLPWRLPHELEWEKAARGVDARAYPWGDEADPSLFCCAESRRVAALVPVTDFPTDESPYGVRGMAGNLAELCFNVWRRDPPSGQIVPVRQTGDVQTAEFLAVRGKPWSAPVDTFAVSGRGASSIGTSRLGGMRLVRCVVGPQR